MRRSMLSAGLFGLILAASPAANGADPAPERFWVGHAVEKGSSRGSGSGATAEKPRSASASPNRPPREPEWLRRLDKNDRATLTGGWALQNWSGGTESLTTAGDRSGPYAPNTYQGGQFLSWNNVATRQEIPSWNGPAPTFPREMWSQGYVSPNTYFGRDAQLWGNMSAGRMQPNVVSGGWVWAE